MAVSPRDIIVVDGNGVVVIPKEDCVDIMNATRRILKNEHVLQEKIQAGATIGELVGIDEVFKLISCTSVAT